MKNITSTATTFNKIFKILQILCTVAIVAIAVGIGILAVGLIFDLPQEMIGTDFHVVDAGIFELHLAETEMPDLHLIWLTMAVQLLLVGAIVFIMKFILKCLRNMLAPMIEGKPFDAAVSKNLRSFSFAMIWQGVAFNAFNLAEHLILMYGYKLPELLLGDSITKVVLNYDFDLTAFLVAALLFLLAHIFRYGETLQQLDDETL